MVGCAQLITTLDGGEYVTPDQLEKELKDELVVAGGRLKLTEVQPQLNVDLSHIQRRLDDLLKDDPSIQFIDGEVFTEDYMDGVAEEINQILQEAGSLRLVELAARFNLSTQFLTAGLKKRVGSVVQGRMDSGMLYTNSYIERQEACIRGAFSGLTRPMAVAELQAVFDFDESLFDPTVDTLLKSGRLKGTMAGKGMRATYTPAIFSESQLQAVNSFYKQNGYIEFSTAEKMLINNPKAFLTKELGASGFCLRSSFAANSLVDTVAAQVEEAVSSSCIIDVAPLLPPFMDAHDHAAVIQKCPCVAKGKTTRVMANSLVVPVEWLKKCSEYISAAAKSDADRLSKALSSEVRAERGGDDSDDDDGGRGKKGKGGKGKGREVEADDDEDDGKKKKGSKRDQQKEEAQKGKGGKGGKGGKDDRGGGGPKGAGKGAGGGQEAGFDFTAETERLVVAFLLQSGGDEGKDLAANDALVAEVAVSVRAEARAAIIEAASSVFSSGAQRRAKRDALQGKFLVLYQQLCLFRKGLAIFSDDQQGPLDKYLLKSVSSGCMLHL